MAATVKGLHVISPAVTTFASQLNHAHHDGSHVTIGIRDGNMLGVSLRRGATDINRVPL